MTAAWPTRTIAAAGGEILVSSLLKELTESGGDIECGEGREVEHNESAEEPIKVRVGLNAGEPIAEDEGLFGTAVNLAARITAAAQGGEILVADAVRQLAKGKDFLFDDRGETALKGFDDPVRLFEVRWRES